MKIPLKKATRALLAVVVTTVLALAVICVYMLKTEPYSGPEFLTYEHNQEQPGTEILEERLEWYPQDSKLQNKNTEKNLKYVLVPGCPIKDGYKVEENGVEVSRVRPVKKSEHKKVIGMLREQGFEGEIHFWEF